MSLSTTGGVPVNTLRTSQTGLDLISGFEQTALTAYLDPVGVWTIGRGHTGADAREGHTITPEREAVLFAADVAEAERTVERHLPDAILHELAPPCWDALVSMAFNVGDQMFRNEDGSATGLRRAIVERRWKDVPTQMRRFVHAGGKRLAGLVRRREAEAALWLRGIAVEVTGDAGVVPEAPPTQRALIQTKTVAGAITTSSGIALQQVSDSAPTLIDASQQLEPVAEFIPWLRVIAVALMVAGVALTVYGRWHALQRETTE